MYSHRNNRFEIIIVVLMILIFVMASYSLFHLNPVFYSKNSLNKTLTESKEGIVPFPAPKEINESAEVQTEMPHYFNISKNFHTLPKKTYSTAYVRKFFRKFTEEDLKEAPLWGKDAESFYVVTRGTLSAKKVEDNSLSWVFQLPANDRFSAAPLITSDNIFLTSNQGKIISLNKAGKLQWILPIEKKLVHTPLIYKGALFLLALDGENSLLTKVNLFNGKLIWQRTLTSFTQPNPITINSRLNLVLITDPIGSLIAIDSHNGNAWWQKKDLGPLKASPMTNGQFAYVGNSDGFAYSLNLKKRSVTWEYQLKSGTESSFAYVPEHRMVCILTNSGYLHCLEALTGEGSWYFNTNNSQPNQQVVALRVDAKSIEKHKLKWKQKGWVLWSPCAKAYICQFNPEEGKILSRIRLRGKIKTPPIFTGKDFYITLFKPEKLPWSTSTEPMPEFSLGKFEVYKPKPRTESDKKSE